MLAVMAVMASLTSCMKDNNDWGVDPTANGNRTWAPIELKAEKGDTFIKIFGFKATNATSYEAQVSKVNFAGASDEDIKKYNFTREDMTPVETRDTMTLGGLEPKTTYYVRVKAKAEGKEDSQWVEYISSKGENTIKTEALKAASATISFGETAPSEAPAYWHDGVMTLYPKGTGFTFDVNKKAFDGDEYPVRMKATGKTESLRLSVSGEGTLKVMVLSANPTTRRVVIEPVDGTPGESQTIAVNNSPETMTLALKAGKYSITWPDGQVNFYAFKYEVNDGVDVEEDKIEEPDPTPDPDPEPSGKTETVAIGSAMGTWTDGGLSVLPTDNGSVMAIEGGKSFTATDGQKFTTRLKTNAVSSDDNNIKVTVSYGGELYIYLQSGSSSDGRTITVTDAEGTEIGTVEIPNSGDAASKTPIKFTLPKAGTYTVGYSKTVYFWGFKLISE